MHIYRSFYIEKLRTFELVSNHLSLDETDLQAQNNMPLATSVQLNNGLRIPAVGLGTWVMTYAFMATYNEWKRVF